MEILNKSTRIIKSKVFHNFHLRAMDGFMKKYFNGKKLVGAEIGVFEGNHADAMLHHLSIKKLYLIDPYYESYDCEIKAKKLLKPFNNKIKFIKDLSGKAIGNIPNNLDFCYIDGNHEYKHVKEDIELYYSKLRDGGVLGGHDFRIPYLDVVNAVLEFANLNDLKILGNNHDWWIIK